MKKTLTNAGVEHLIPSTAERPTHHDFMTTRIVDSEGKTVPEDAWKMIVTPGAEGRALTMQLKKLKMYRVRVFDATAFDAALKDYNIAKTEKLSAIVDEAFVQANAQKDKHIENALRTLAPLFKNANVKKTLISFRNIIKNAASSKNNHNSGHPA